MSNIIYQLKVHWKDGTESNIIWPEGTTLVEIEVYFDICTEAAKKGGKAASIVLWEITPGEHWKMHDELTLV